jgi:hypothetical protein
MKEEQSFKGFHITYCVRTTYWRWKQASDERERERERCVCWLFIGRCFDFFNPVFSLAHSLERGSSFLRSSLFSPFLIFIELSHSLLPSSRNNNYWAMLVCNFVSLDSRFRLFPEDGSSYCSVATAMEERTEMWRDSKLGQRWRLSCVLYLRVVCCMFFWGERVLIIFFLYYLIYKVTCCVRPCVRPSDDVSTR